MKTPAKLIAGVGALALTFASAAAEGLPQDIPARKPGLWEMVTTGTVGPNQLKAIKRYCLDADADRTLHELHIQRMELEVIYNDVDCPPPKFTVNSNVLTGEMACRTNSQDDDEAAGKDFFWKMTFASESDVVLEEHSIPRDVMLLLENNLTERQQLRGECPADMKPGDSVDLGFTYNSEAWPDKENRGNIHESLKVVRKMLNEAHEINKRLGPM